jgi:hypothetical protein
MHNAAKFNSWKAKEKQVYFENKVLEWKSKQEIVESYKEGYSPAQLADLYRHEIGFEHFNLIESSFKKSNKKVKRILLFKGGMSKSMFVNRLKKIVPYTKEFFDIHLSKPQSWKVKFRHLDKNEKEIASMVKKQLQKWQKITCESRKEKQYYNKMYSIEYWKNNSDNPEQSLYDYKQRNTPSCIEFWTSRGYNVDEAKKQISKRAKKGGIAACQSLNGNNVSKLEKRIYELIGDSRVIHQKHLGPYSYDLCFNKKIIEINGTYWHADPRIYKNESQVLVHGKVADIRKKDKLKREYAKEKHYDFMVIWELDYCKNPDSVIESIKTFFGI